MQITLNGVDYEFSDNSEIIPKESFYDLELVEPGFNEETQKLQAGGVDSTIKLPPFIENEIMRTSLLPVAKIFLDANGKKRLKAYFD